ncbi:hypothetical protein RRF57_002822 [Xylaria bambusicola]|uniref:Uncharacterized protein n=1 Tax=Xylaria bambusicola TaxID=326684 RepID=A0AAN7Z258_9PEZI
MGIAQGFGEGSKRLMEGEWRNATYAGYVKAPLENLFPLDQTRLCGSLADGECMTDALGRAGWDDCNRVMDVV